MDGECAANGDSARLRVDKNSGAFFQRGEIEKAERNRLLHLKDERRSDEHPGDVRLNQPHLDRVMRVR